MNTATLPSTISRPVRPALRLADGAVLMSLIAVLLVVRGFAFGSPVYGMDDQLYSFIGARLLEGEWPFVDWWDRKPFGLFALFAFAHATGGPGPAAFQLLAGTFVLGGAWLVYRAALALTDRVGAALAAVVMVVLLTLYSGAGGQSEAFHVPMMVAAMYLVRDHRAVQFRRRALVAMAICGLALQVKYTVLPQCLFLGLWCLWSLHRHGTPPRSLLGNAGLFVALGLAPTFAVAGLYAAMGEFDAFWFANFESFFLREGAGVSRFHAGQLGWVLPLALPLLGAAVVARLTHARCNSQYRFYALWSASVVATVLLPSTIYLFYLGALAPCVALLSTPLFAKAGRWGRVPGLAVVLVLVGQLDLPERYSQVPAEAREAHRFAAAVRAHVDASERCLLVFDGPMSLYRLSGGCAMSRFVYPDHLNNRLERDALGVSQTGEVARILARAPAVIVTADRPVTPQNREAARLIGDAIAADYVPLAQTQVNGRMLTAWRRVR